MLAPKKLKHRKPHRPNIRSVASGNTELAFGKFALKAVTSGWVNSQQLEAARRVLSRVSKRGGKIWIRVFPHQAITVKGTQATMGGGKGAPEYYVAVVRAGTILFEMDGVPQDKAQESMELAAYKLPVKTKFIFRS